MIRGEAGRVQFYSTVRGYQWPGSEYLWADSAEALLKAGYHIKGFVSSEFSGAKRLNELQALGMDTVFVPLANSPIKRSIRRITGPGSGWTRNTDLLVVSCGSLFDVCFCPGLYHSLMKTNIPYCLICQFNAETFWFDNSMRDQMRNAYAKAAGSVFISQQNLTIAERQLATHIRNTQVITNPVWIEEHKRAPPWPKYSEVGGVQMACVARLDTRWKGQDVLFEILSQPQWNDRHWTLNLYGEGPEKGYLERLAEHYDLTERIVFHGVVTDVSEIWARNHIQVLPTRAEGGPMVITEGMACGRTAVSTHCGHIPEFLTDGLNGFLADFPTSRCFGMAMERAWHHRHQWEKMGAKAKNAVRSIENQGGKLFSFLEGLLNS